MAIRNTRLMRVLIAVNFRLAITGLAVASGLHGSV
jgi:hypothetical protein